MAIIIIITILITVFMAIIISSWIRNHLKCLCQRGISGNNDSIFVQSKSSLTNENQHKQQLRQRQWKSSKNNNNNNNDIKDSSLKMELSMKKIIEKFFQKLYRKFFRPNKLEQSIGLLKVDRLSSLENVYHLPYAPGPFTLPIIGNLFQLAKYSNNPWVGFDNFRQQFGPICRLQLGRFPTVLISSVETMREVLITKGEHFANRPHFNRHALYFDMDRQNALALCDWTDVHKQRRSIAHAAVIPRFGTQTFQRLSGCIRIANQRLLQQIRRNDDSSSPGNGMKILQKQSIIQLSCQIFFHFLLDKDIVDSEREGMNCGSKIDDSLKSFVEIAEKFDYIFSDINEMYISDFLPFLQYFTPIRRYFHSLYQCSTWIFRQVEQIVMERFEQLCLKRKQQKIIDNGNGKISGVTSDIDKSSSSTSEINCDERFVDRILLQKQYKSSAKFLDFILEHYLENERTMQWNEMMYEIGDLVGGNSAVGNLLFRLLGHLAINPEAQQQLYDQVKSIAIEKEESIVNLNEEAKARRQKNVQPMIMIEDQHRLPLVTAAIMETLRLTLSPIVPHLSRWDTSIQGYFIPKGTMILFNIYHLNLSEKLYPNPFKFDPKRFITDDGSVLKPDHFFPFSHGRRSCLGYKMVNTIISTTVANLLLEYRLTSLSLENHKQIERMLQPKGSLALPYRPGDCYNIGLITRN